MHDEDKTREQLISELRELREQVAQSRKKNEERKQVEHALQESRQMLRLVLDTVPARVFWKDLQSNYLGCNRPFALDAGVQSPEGIIGRNDFEMPWAAEAELYRSDDRQVMETGRRKLGYEEPMTMPDGRRVWLRTNKVPLLDSGGRIKGVLGTYEDMTELKRTEAQMVRLSALRERLLGRDALNEKLRTITEAAVQIHDADFARIWITREGDLCEKGCSHAQATEGPHVCRDRTRCLHLEASAGRYTHMDGNHRRVPLGAYKIGKIASGKDTFFLTNDVTHDPFVHNHEWAEDLGLVSFAGFRLISPDGTTIGVLALFKKWPIAPEEMRFLEDLANTASQVIQAGMAEEALRESENRFRSLVLNSSDTVTVLAADGTVKYQSPSLKRFLGYEPEKVIGNNVFHYVHPDDLASAQAAFSQILERPGRSVSLECRFRHADGSWVFVESLGSSLLDDPGIKGVVLNSRDISERKRAEEALRDSSEKLKLFAYSVAHDLKSPAIGIHGLVKRLSKNYRDVLDERGKNYCDLILRASEHIAALVDKVNVYIATKESGLSIETVNVGEVLQMLDNEFSAQLAIRRIGWIKPESAIAIKADRLSMIRAFRNFVDNSLKYGGKRLTKIWTDYEETDDFHIFSFRDNGKGMKDEDSEKIFKAFQRNKTSRGVEGTGLGLSIVKEIAERHGGKVWVEARTKRGITFHISVSKNLQIG